MSTFATNYPVLFAIIVTIAWLVMLVVFMGIASSAFHKPYGDAATGTIGRLAVTACTLLLVWHLGWLTASGVARLGSWQAWLLALGGMIYFASASLYSFYGKVAFDFSSLRRSSASRPTILTHFAAGLSEEIVFRGAVLYGLARVWGNTKQGMVGSVTLTSLLFAVLHITQVFTHGVSRSSALLLTLETFLISIWWGALTLWGGSIWPAFMLHFVVSAIVAVQGLKIPLVEPDILAYRRILRFSIPLGVLGISLLVQTAPRF
jgi:membrane protease YdiL (CAAX protease family)